MKKVAVVAKSVCVNALVCSAAAVLLSACGAGMPDATKSKPGMFAGVMQVSAAVATNGTNPDPATTPAVADQAAADAASGAGTDPAAASGLPGVPGAEQGGAGGAPGYAAVDQSSVSAAPAAAPGYQVAPGTAGAAAATPAQGADSFALVGYGPNAAGNQAAAAAASQGPVWPDPQDAASAIRQ